MVAYRKCKGTSCILFRLRSRTSKPILLNDGYDYTNNNNNNNNINKQTQKGKRKKKKKPKTIKLLNLIRL